MNNELIKRRELLSYIGSSALLLLTERLQAGLAAFQPCSECGKPHVSSKFCSHTSMAR